MTFNISEYTPDVSLPNYKQTDYSLGLEMAVLGKKNQEQAKALQTINNLQNKSLNISMLNLEGKQRLDGYNKEISEKLSGDLGDLTKPESQNKIATLFQKVAGDTDLIKASQLSKQYQSEFDNVQRLKTSGRKDSGYSDINEYVWMNWDGGYYDFMKKGLGEVSDPNFKPSNYSPYKDLRTPLANLTKLLHEDVVSREQQTMGTFKQPVLDKNGKPTFDKSGNIITEEGMQPTGYLTKNTYGGVSPERVKALYEEQFGQDGISQVETMSKYEILKARESQGGIDSIYNQYQSHANSEKVTGQAQKKETEERLLFNNSLLKKTGLSEEEKIKLIQENAAHERNLGVIDSNLKNIEESHKEKDDFLKLSNPELLGYVYQIQKQEKIKNAVNALSWKKDLQELSPDATYLAAKKIDAMMAQAKFREDSALNRLKISLQYKSQISTAKEKTAKDKNPAVYSDGDISKNNVDLLSSYDKLVQTQEQYAKKSDNIIAAPSLDNNSIKSNNWSDFYEKNKDNYYVQMWDTFKTSTDMAYDVNGNPNKEAFRLWMENEEKNPSQLTQENIAQHKNDEFVADYLTGELGTIDSAIRAAVPESKALLPYARTADGQQVSEADFYSGKDIYINVPTSPKANGMPYTGGYQKKPLKDIIYDLENAGTITETIDDGRFKSTVTKDKPTYLDNDYGLKVALTNFRTKSKDPLILNTLANKLPQFQQYGYSQTSDPDEVAKYEGEISSATKNQSESFRTLIGSKGIESIAIPKGAGTKGIVKFKTEYAKDLSEAGIQLPTADGNVMEIVVPGRAYLFDTTPIQGRDVMMNMAVKNKPFVKNYSGFNYKIESKRDGTKIVVIKKPDGTIITPAQGGIGGTDINEVITNVEKFINTIKG